MGCFSFLCRECGKPILSSSFRGQPVKLFLLKGGEVIEEMEGEYDSYGGVFNSDQTESIHWKMEWGDVCDLIHSGEYEKDAPTFVSELQKEEFIKLPPAERSRFLSDILMNRPEPKFILDTKDGIAAVHTKCWRGITPTTQSEYDPNQGWGENNELLGQTSSEEVV